MIRSALKCRIRMCLRNKQSILRLHINKRLKQAVKFYAIALNKVWSKNLLGKFGNQSLGWFLPQKERWLQLKSAYLCNKKMGCKRSHRTRMPNKRKSGMASRKFRPSIQLAERLIDSLHQSLISCQLATALPTH